VLLPEYFDVAYLRLGRDEVLGPVASVPFRPPGSEDAAVADLVLDFDREGRLVGVEVFSPKQGLLPSVLAGAHRRT
jgi:Protein of unknown function (DUF2283)